MNGNGPIREDRKIEYQIRKYQRALGLIQKTDYNAGSYRPGQAWGGDKVKRQDILAYADKIITLKKRLYELTGRCSPLRPKWPL